MERSDSVLSTPAVLLVWTVDTAFISGTSGHQEVGGETLGSASGLTFTFTSVVSFTKTIGQSPRKEDVTPCPVFIT